MESKTKMSAVDAHVERLDNLIQVRNNNMATEQKPREAVSRQMASFVLKTNENGRTTGYMHL
jgi:endonuclease III